MNAKERENFQSVLLYFQFIYVIIINASTLTALLISAQDVRPALYNTKCYCNCFRMFCVNQSRWPCGLRRRSEAAWISGIAGSNYAEGVDLRLLYLLCAV
jgi:hypothetical protein